MLPPHQPDVIYEGNYPSPVPDNDATPKRSFLSRAPRRPSMVPREVVMGLDPTRTRHQSLWRRHCPRAGAGHRHRVVAQPSDHHDAQARQGQGLSERLPEAREHVVRTHREDHAQPSGRSSSSSSCSWHSVCCTSHFAASAPGSACFAIFLGLGLGLGAGAVFFFLGAWLIIRAYRLQKYGVAGMVASNQVAREMSLARREGREPNLGQLPEFER